MDLFSMNPTDSGRFLVTTSASILSTQYHNTSFQNISIPDHREADLREETVNSILVSANDKVFDTVLMPSMIYLIVLLVTGLPGNAMVCLIYHNKLKRTFTGKTFAHVRKSSDIFILALAWLDVLNCVLSVPVEIIVVRYFLTFDHEWICKLSRFFAMVFNAASSFVLIGIATDRFIGIKYSQSKYRFTDKVAIKFVIGSIMIALALSWPGLVLYGTMSVPLAPNVVGKTCLIQDTYLRTPYPLILSTFLLSMHLLFDLFFIILYSVIGKTVVINRNVSSFRSKRTTNHKHAHRNTSSINISSIALSTCAENSLSDFDLNKNVSLTSIKALNVIDDISGSRPNKPKLRSNTKKLSECYGQDSAVHGKVYQAGKTTFILFAVTIVFMLTFAPYCAIAIIRNVSSADFYENLSDTEKMVYQLFLRSYLLSSSVNPLIYCFLSQRFRQEAKTMIYKTINCNKENVIN